MSLQATLQAYGASLWFRCTNLSTVILLLVKILNSQVSQDTKQLRKHFDLLVARVFL
jgi:hypothetical protein